MSIKRLNAISELEAEIRMLNADIRKYEREIESHQKYIDHLQERYCSPINTINKYKHKIKETRDMLQHLYKTRWFVRKELAMWRQGHEF